MDSDCKAFIFTTKQATICVVAANEFEARGKLLTIAEPPFELKETFTNTFIVAPWRF
jgi:hypothetical protein